MGARRPIDANVEVNDETVATIIDGLSEFGDDIESRGQAICRSYGLEEGDSATAYPLRNVLEALDELTDTLGADLTVRLWTKIPEAVAWPSNVETVRAGFESIDEAYQMNHWGGDIGYYEFTQTADRKGVVTCANPYPCPFDRGLIKGTLWAFSDQFTRKPMIHLHEISDRCRCEGGQQCNYRVWW